MTDAGIKIIGLWKKTSILHQSCLQVPNVKSQVKSQVTKPKSQVKSQVQKAKAKSSQVSSPKAQVSSQVPSPSGLGQVKSLEQF